MGSAGGPTDVSEQDEAEPIAGTGRFDLQVAARPESLRRVRRALEGLPLPHPLIDDAKLLTTELVTNSIRHAGLGPGERVTLTAEWTGPRLRVSVRDPGSGGQGSVIAGSIRPNPGPRSGWGLYLVDQLATRWGTNFENGTEFWFELEIPSRDES